ncbi:elongation of very long chain fatty acids protein AAEL008004-like [Argiope bruennichi]|uniref:Elongation of very long chain fatty acids protein n=1 Tax=Argiope bruennichi TaxID=94029 RepID=A0A8T0F018_ARGBR|nr:elongation of very long chain fatty acids protein AAEL008004-like [Argiope bruennichi]XP_055933779.1 elongation of very long chain fatty acids protein AAEL008004-like [Argiope bruennichi]XP_055933780.1 elongation of very long chain fatty acids protein AAEL008004-like [Argiope bruennichi]XP_055933781.1 elongation of very long chain fatty acids protein AAEL008004-like [Argiope bruennichi]XP_055933782.1 elongation of very long chain fatty acids protein AAEL008004-like [Argiope bruennichi]KAF87
MAGILQILNNSFKSFLDQGDPRVKDWPMMQTPFPGMAMIAAYIYFVKVAGPQFMKKRKPFDLRWPMVIYNFMLVFISLALFLGLGWYSYFNGYSLKCQPVDYSNKIEAVRLAQIGYLFYLTKFVEFADTIFFVLRKKDNQISALHVIHHSIVPFSLWFGIKFAPGGYNTLFPFLNSFVHVIMYGYYGVAALGEKYKKYLFWKKYMTYIQLAQFVCVMVYAVSLYINKCDIPKTFIVMNFIHALLFLALFLNFFIKNYIQKPSVRSRSTLVSTEKASMVKMANGGTKENGFALPTISENGEISTHRRNIHRCCHEEDCLCKSDTVCKNGFQNGSKVKFQ